MSVNPLIAANASGDFATIVAGVAIFLVVAWLIVQVTKLHRAMKGGS